MSDLSRVMSNREYDTFLKERKAEAFKRCDPIVQGASRVADRRVCRVHAEPVSLGGLGV